MAKQCAICGQQLKLNDPKIQISQTFLCQNDGYQLCRGLGYHTPPSIMEVTKLAFVTVKQAKEAINNYHPESNSNMLTNQTENNIPVLSGIHTPVDPSQIIFKKPITFIAGKKEIQAPGMFNNGKYSSCKMEQYYFLLKLPILLFISHR